MNMCVCVSECVQYAETKAIFSFTNIHSNNQLVSPNIKYYIQRTSSEALISVFFLGKMHRNFQTNEKATSKTNASSTTHTQTIH